MALTSIRVNLQGAQTLLDELQSKYGLTSGDVVSLLELDNVLLLSPKRSRVAELASQIEKIREDAGLDEKDLLDGLDDQRRRYVQEKYGPKDE